MKIKYLNTFWFAITLIIAYPKMLYAQSLVNRIKPTPLDSQHFKIVRMRTSEILDSKTGIAFKIMVEKGHPLYIRLRNDGGMLAFQDSIFEKPVPIEKRNFYHFPDWKLFEEISVYFAYSIPDHGFLRIALKAQTLLDDLYLCMPQSRQEIKGIILKK